jgi:hypothetical protein
MFSKLFGHSRFLDADLEDWCLETWAWLMRNLGGRARLEESAWITPTPEFFPKTEAIGADRARHVCDCVRQAMGMADWPVRLEPFERLAAHQQVAEHAFVNSPQAPSGTFSVEGNEVVIRYAGDLVAQPHELTATFAHELCHYLLATIAEPVPGGEDAHELATDLCVAYAGLGLFGANAAFSFSQHGDAFSQGWQSRRSGYLSERTWAFALALFGALQGEPAPERWLKPGLVSMTRAAQRYLTKTPSRIAPLADIT